MKARITFDKGLNADIHPTELPDGFASDCDWVRFPGVGAERIGGLTSTATFVGSPSWLGKFTTGAGVSFVVGVGESSKVAYAYQVGGSSTASEITRYTEGIRIDTMTAVGTTVTVNTIGNHGLSTGNIISVWNSSPSTYNAEGVSITVVDVDTFTYTVASAPATTPASVTGMYSVGTTRSAFSTAGSSATGGNYGGLLIVNLPSDGIYYWAGDTTIPMRKLRAGRATTAVVARPFRNYIVRLGETTSGVSTPYRIAWSESAEPGSVPTVFIATTTNDAGYVEKPDIGLMVDCLALGEDNIVYGTNGRIRMRYIGGNQVFSFEQLPGDEGLYSINCVANTPIGHVFLSTERSVLVHSGGQVTDLSRGRVKSILADCPGTVFRLAVHPKRPEVWVMYRAATPSAGNTNPDSALVWNWESNTWGKCGFGCWSALGAGTTNKSFYGISGNTLYTLDDSTSSEDETATDYTAYVERTGIAAGDPDVAKNLARSRPIFDTNSSSFPNPTITIQHGSSMFPDTAPTYASGVSYTIGTTDYANARATGGKYLAWKGSLSLASGNAGAGFYNIRLRSVDLDFTLGGRR